MTNDYMEPNDANEGESESEQAFSDNYKKAYDNLMAQGGRSPRSCRRFLDSIAKRNLKKFLKSRKH